MALFEKAFTDSNLREAYDKVRRKNASPGVDGVTVAGYGWDLDRNLATLQSRLLRGQYKPLPVLRCHIPKTDGDFRRIGIPSVVDRVAQRALLDTLMPIVDSRLAPCSYAYRPRRSVRQAIAEAQRLRDLGHPWCVRTDIDLCFESIPHDPLLQKVWSIVPDKDCVNIIKRWITAGVVDGPDLRESGIGVKQGDVLSPVLCNIYLDTLDRTLLARGHQLVRYADDMLLLSSGKSHAATVLKDVEQSVGAIGLRCDPQKTEVTSFIGGFRFLGAIFVGSMALPAVRVVHSDGGAHYTVGYGDPAGKLRMENAQQRLTFRVIDGVLTDHQIARTLAAEVARERRGQGSPIGRALLEAWKTAKEEEAQQEATDWDDHGSWGFVL